MATQPQVQPAPSYARRESCRLCDGKQLSLVLSLGDQYVVNFVREKDTTLPHAPLDWVQCDDCGLLQLLHTVSPDLLWGGDYWYRSGINATMKLALADVVESGLKLHNHGVWLDIGANDGTLLSQVPGTFEKIACEPSPSFHPLLEEHATVIPEFFSANHEMLRNGEHGRCDVVTSCAMFYDLDAPNDFVRDVKLCLSRDGIWINQLSDTALMLKQMAFDNITHEHVCYYDIDTLKRLYDKHGLRILHVSYNDVNGGSIRVVADKRVGKPADGAAGAPRVHPGDTDRFADRVQRWKYRMRDLILGMFGNQAVWAYGASTKGISLLGYLDLNNQFVAVADRNPQKHGLVMAGSWIPITDETTCRRARPGALVVLPWAFEKEFIEREQELINRGTALVMPLPNIKVVV